MRTIDLCWPIKDGMQVFPGDPVPSVCRVTAAEKNETAFTLMTLGSHTGTHMDAPAHVIAGGKTLDDFPCEKFFGIALVADVTKCVGRKIGKSDIIASARDIGSVDFLLLHTGWSSRWGDLSYTRGYPVLSEAAARWLTSLKLKGVGADALSVDEADSRAIEIHKILLGQELLIIENMRNLELVAGESFCLAALPLPLEKADGAPARVIAVLE